jgi:hypothetical protein
MLHHTTCCKMQISRVTDMLPSPATSLDFPTDVQRNEISRVMHMTCSPATALHLPDWH